MCCCCCLISIESRAVHWTLYAFIDKLLTYKNVKCLRLPLPLFTLDTVCLKTVCGEYSRLVGGSTLVCRFCFFLVTISSIRRDHLHINDRANQIDKGILPSIMSHNRAPSVYLIWSRSGQVPEFPIHTVCFLVCRSWRQNRAHFIEV